MKLFLTVALALSVCAPAFAAEVDQKVDPKIDRAVHDLLPVCADATVKYEELSVKLPARFSGNLVTIESPRHSCEGSMAMVVAPSGALFLGSPWPLSYEEGKTIEEKLKTFAWRNLHESMSPTVDRTRNADGLYAATLNQVTTSGRLPLKGYVDPDGIVFFFGSFRPANTDVRASRAKLFDSFVTNAPAKGAAKPAVTIMEFSDFQCPSCQRASGYVDAILEKHADQVRYVRYDLPLSGHSWAFSAALAGRAIYRQKPELFWEYKKQVYSNQADFSPFTFADWARGFAKDHELDLARYDADLESNELKNELLSGAGTALSNDVRATPTYIVNGSLVEAGDGGTALAAYVDKLLTK